MRSDDGTTLMELAVVLAILGVVLLIVYQGIIAFQGAVSDVDHAQQNLNEARQGVNVLDQALRTATPLDAGQAAFVTADDLEVTFFANLDSDEAPAGPRKVRFYVDGDGRLVQEVTAPDAASTPPDYTYAGTPTNRVLTTNIVNDESTPLFVFRNSVDDPVATPVTGSPLMDIRAIDISVRVEKNAERSGSPDTTLVNRVRLPNVAPPTPTPAAA